MSCDLTAPARDGVLRLPTDIYRPHGVLSTPPGIPKQPLPNRPQLIAVELPEAASVRGAALSPRPP